MYPQVPIEMLPNKETVSNAHQQTPPYPVPYDNQQQVPPPVQPQVIIVQQNLGLPPLGSRSVHLTCPTCKTDIYTSVTSNSTGWAYFWCMSFLCCVCCSLYSCIPFCMDRFKVFKHSCPNCKAYIGTYRP